MTRYVLSQTVGRPSRWSVLAEGSTQVAANQLPYDVACAIARHLNGQDPEPGDITALVTFALDTVFS